MGGQIDATMAWAKQRARQIGSTAQHPPRRTQNQEQAAAEDEKAGGHGVLSVKDETGVDREYKCE